MGAAANLCSEDEFAAALSALNGGVPDAEAFQRLGTMLLDAPEVSQLNRLDPFSADYRSAVLDLYKRLRASPNDDYRPERDESPSFPVPDDIWTRLSPWSFQDPTFVGENLYAWGHIMRHLAVPPCGSVLEYGPGSGQLILMLARMGFRAHGVDIDAVSIETIRLQAAAMGLPVATECALFGEGFGDQRFDGIVFYEAFHHALDFMPLLRRLHDRLTPDGRLILCGEPVLEGLTPGVPFPWGPRLDALSVFCMRRFGWMELGFTHAFFTEAARRTGWRISFHPFPGCGRAHVYVLQKADSCAPEAPLLSESPVPASRHIAHLTSELEAATAAGKAACQQFAGLEAIAVESQSTRLAFEAMALEHQRALSALAALQASTSWRLTSPLRRLVTAMRRR